MGRSLRMWVGLLGAAMVLLSPALAAAQGDEITFGEEEVQPTDETGGGGDDEFNFSVDDVVEDASGPPVTGVMLAADAGIDPALVDALSAHLMSQLDQLPGFSSKPNAEVKVKFSDMGQTAALECAYDPLCLGRVGAESGVEKLVIGRLSGSDGSYDLNIDLINITDNSIENYYSRTVKGDQGDLQETITKGIPRLFRIQTSRRKRRKKDEPAAEAGPIQKGLAWGTLGLSAVSLGVGLYFGLDASSIQDELENGDRRGELAQNPYVLTQREADARLDEANDSALMANIFYGVSLASGLTSILLFTITPGEDIASEEELQSGIQDFRIVPTVSAESSGVAAGFSW